jgi:lactoylglutathione lyase
MVKEIRHTGIVVTDMDRALSFYRDLLGLKNVVVDRIVEGPFFETLTALDGARIRIVMLATDEGSKVELLQYLSHPRPAPPRHESCDIGCSHVAFTVSDLDRMHEEMTARGVHFKHPPQIDDLGYAKVAYLHDFDGTIVELVEIVDARNTPYS